MAVNQLKKSVYKDCTILLNGGERGSDSALPAPRPTGALCASKIAPGNFVEPNLFDSRVQIISILIIKKAPKGAFLIIWRRERDSNPRYGSTVYTLSRRAPSATRPSLLKTNFHRLVCDASPSWLRFRPAQTIQVWAFDATHLTLQPLGHLSGLHSRGKNYTKKLEPGRNYRLYSLKISREAI